MAGGTLKKHPTSGALLLNPLRQLQRCTCCGECEYAIRAEPCWQELNVDCETTIPPIWLCVESKCFGSEQTLGQTKTPVVFLYTVPGDIERCYQTIPGSAILVSKLDEEIVADLITDTALECLEEGCQSAQCGEPENTCACVCRSTKNDFPFDTDCCMSRLLDGVAPWTFTYRRTIVSTVENENRGSGSPFSDCVGDDCRGSAACTFFSYEEEIDHAELEVPLAMQGCTKVAPLRQRVTIQHVGTIPPSPILYPCCGEPNTGSDTWSSGGEIVVSPPTTRPLEVIVNESEPIEIDGCVSKFKITTMTEGDCTFFRSETVTEVWSGGIINVGEESVCICQQYQRSVDLVEYTFSPAGDEATQRICAQCAAAEAEAA